MVRAYYLVVDGVRRQGGWRGGLLVVALAAGAASLGLTAGCAFDRHRERLRELHASGQYEAAHAALLDEQTAELYEGGDELLLQLDRGAVALAIDHDDEAVTALDEAEALMEQRRSETFLESLGVLLINDRQGPYLGEPYEDMYVNVLKMLAHLEAGRIQGGASVEARRMATKANTLRDAYLRFESRTRDEFAGSAAASAAAGSMEALRGVAAVDSEGEFIESPLGVFLTALTYMQTGDPSNQAVAARRLMEAIEAQGSLIGPVDAAPFEGLEEMAPERASAVVVALSGRGPYKVPFRLPPLVIYRTPVYMEIPVLRWEQSEVARARVAVRSADAGGTTTGPLAPGTSVMVERGSEGEAIGADLHLIEDMAAVANENHRRQLPLIYLRTVLRTAAKAVAATFAAEAVERSADSDAAGLGVALGGLLLMLATERADLRAWVFLPGHAHVGVLDLEDGAWEARVEFIGLDGRLLHASAWRRFEVGYGREMTTVVEHYWN